MATLTVWKFDDADGRGRRRRRPWRRLAKQELITMHDAATVSWPADAKKPKTRQLQNLAGAGALGGAFWGLLFGLLFFIPLLGLAIGAAAGALAGSLTDVGIDDDFISSVRDAGHAGHVGAVRDDLGRGHGQGRGCVRGQHIELISTNLSAKQERTLRDAFAESGQNLAGPWRSI